MGVLRPGNGALSIGSDDAIRPTTVQPRDGTNRVQSADDGLYCSSLGQGRSRLVSLEVGGVLVLRRPGLGALAV